MCPTVKFDEKLITHTINYFQYHTKGYLKKIKEKRGLFDNNLSKKFIFFDHLKGVLTISSTKKGLLAQVAPVKIMYENIVGLVLFDKDQ